jgi:hypothetical protein
MMWVRDPQKMVMFLLIIWILGWTSGWTSGIIFAKFAL